MITLHLTIQAEHNIPGLCLDRVPNIKAMRQIYLLSVIFLLISFSFKEKRADHTAEIPVIQTGNDTLNKDLSNIISILENDSLSIAFLKAYKNRNIYFVPQKKPDRIVDLVVYKGKPLRYKFRYDYNEFPYLPEAARKAIIIHEMYHIYKGSGSDNDHDHEAMTKDPLFLNALKKVFPDENSYFYKNMSFAGTIGSPVFEHLTSNQKDELISFFHRYNIYY